ncbi:MAG: DUF1353 domain-containing protein [Bradyrhizobium sp.]
MFTPIRSAPAMLFARKICLFVLIAFSSLSELHAADQTRPFGWFPDELKVRLESDGRRMVLLNDYRFIDPGDETWTAKTGSTVDGASIPQPFWSFIGGPLDGAFRNASVIHDYFCITRTKTWQETHKAFYNGMRANGVSELKANVMYYAVLAFGPRWGLQARNKNVCSENNGKIECGIVVVNDEERVDVPTTPEDVADVAELEKKLQSGAQISLPELEQMAVKKGNPRFPRELRK